MRRILTCWALAALTLLGACQKHGAGADPVQAEDFVMGADISWVTWMEAAGFKFFNAAGQERECTALLREIGGDAVRLRVWVNPADGWCGKDDVVVKAKRAQALGLKVMVDFHYSDSWADPGKQPVPEAWKTMGPEAMAQALAAHTREVLQALKDAGVDSSDLYGDGDHDGTRRSGRGRCRRYGKRRTHRRDHFIRTDPAGR